MTTSRKNSTQQQPAPQQQTPQQPQTPAPQPQQPQQLNSATEDVVFLGIRRPGVEGLFQEPLPRQAQNQN